MLGVNYTGLLVTAALLCLTQTGVDASARVADDNTSLTLQNWKKNAEYVIQCVLNHDISPFCDWTRAEEATEDISVSSLESDDLGLEGEACLEFWYLEPLVANGSELTVLLNERTKRTEIWTSPAISGDAWRQVFVPLTLSDATTKVVFEAVQGLPMEGHVTFDRIGVRKGQCGSQCEGNTEFWADESTQCLCSGGQLSCSPSQCAQGQNCGPQRASTSGGNATTPGTCTVHSDPHCSTFDGTLFRFLAPCTYILAKTCSAAEAMPTFSVEVVNEQRGNSSVSAVQQVNVQVQNLRVSLLKTQTHRVMVNGLWKTLPLSLNGGAIKIRGNPVAVVVETDFNLLISYDNRGAVHVTVPPTYSGQICGMCGNFNNRKDDDYLMPDGSRASDATVLAQSWQPAGSSSSSSSCETAVVPHKCNPQELAEYATEPYCGGLLSGSGPFSGCLSVLGAESYFRSCVTGMCTSHGDVAVLCETLQDYAALCQEAGVIVPAWRNATLCPLECGLNSHYNSCAEGCPEVCSSLDLAEACGSCVERCECDPGFKRSGGKCVTTEDCGCWQNGEHYEKGAVFVAGECEQRCLCMGNNNVQCSTMFCANNEVCKVMDGVKGCFLSRPVTCGVYGDPHYITFDGTAYDFQGGCNYTLATTCGGHSRVQFTVTGRNFNPIPRNLTRSKLETVVLQVEGLHLTLNQSGDVYVHGNRINLPYYTNGTYGSLAVYTERQYIVLETDFGLRMMIGRQNRLFLQVDERYLGTMVGLCGTYSGAQGDDFVMPDGSVATDDFQFGNSWRVMEDHTRCIAYPDDPRPCDSQEEINQAYLECSILRDAFPSCHSPVHFQTYLASCVYDYCATRGDRNTLCDSIESYVAACEVEGVELSHWQNATGCTDPTTTPIPPTTPTTPTPPSTTINPTSCPLNCNFDSNMCGWSQLVQDSFDWTRHSGPTPSNPTGPRHDHTTGTGYYLYIEGDTESVTHGDSARLLTPRCNHGGPVCLRFWYHMYGSARAMALNIYLLQGITVSKVWSRVNQQGDKWRPAHVDIRDPHSFKIIVEAIRGSRSLSDVAIDDFSIQFGSCSGSSPFLISGPSVPPTVVAKHPVCHLDCNFDSNLCSWSQLLTDAFDWTWASGSTPTLMTGPSADHTSGGGHYLYIEANRASHGDTARLLSSECSHSGPQCLQFWYHMHGSADTMGLHVYLLQDRFADAVWWNRNDQGNRWRLGQVDIATTGPFQIVFEGRRGSNDLSDVAIDDVRLYRGRCSDLTPNPPTPAVSTTSPAPTTSATAAPPPTVANATAWPLTTAEPPAVNVTLLPPSEMTAGTSLEVCKMNCDFEQDLCQWNQLVTDAFDWTRHSGSTPTTMTGPSSDHTKGSGHYLYIEASSASHGDTARLLSSECSHSGPQCLQFWYHMHGSADTMGLHVYLLQDRLAESVWWTRNDQGNMWQLAQVDFTTTGPFQILFEGRRGSNDKSDVGIDDVSLHHGRCVAPPTAGPVTTEKPVPPPVNYTTTPQPPTTARPKPPTTARPQPPTTARPQPPTTARPQPPTTARPQPPTTARPQPPTTARPQPPTTARPQPPTTARPQPPTTARPQPPPTATTQPTTTTTKAPTTACNTQTTTRPQTTATPETPTIANPDAQATTRPVSPTTPRPQPPTTARPQPPPTARPQPPTTAAPKPPTTATPNPPTAATPKPPTTARPQPPTTARPQPSTTERPEPSTTARPQPPTTARPTPSCPKNSHYTTCIPACQPTCKHLYGPPSCQADEPCVQGCMCDDGFVWQQRMCVPIQQCGCVDRNGNSHHFGDVWYTSHCSKKCECEEDNGVGEIDCEDEDECNGDAVCLQNEAGQYYCKSTDFSECTINGDPEYRTFDDGKHDFEGEHSYVLVQTTRLPENLQDVYIESINSRDDQGDDERSSEEHNSHSEEHDSHSEEHNSHIVSRHDDSDEDDDSKEHGDHQRMRSLKIRVYNHTVEFRKNKKLILDGQRTRTPVSPTGGLQIRERYSRLYLKTDFGLSVEFDGDSRAEIILPHVYKRRVAGLCGNFDGKKKNDLMKPDGSQAKSVKEFGQSWRVTEEPLSIQWRR